MAVINAVLGSILLLVIIEGSNGMKSDQVRLMEDLFKDYDANARPVKNSSDVVTVQIGLAYNEIKDLDEPSQVLVSLVWIVMHWHDPYLRWNVSDYGGHSFLSLNPSRIWTPDIELHASTKDDQGHISSDTFRITLDSEGNVSWPLTKILYSSCPIDVSDFPFDTQKCTIRFYSWTHDASAVDLQLQDGDGIDLKSYRESSEWKLKSITSEKRLRNYPCCPAPFADVTYSLEFERKTLYYIMTIISPSMLLSLLACISFLFPADSGERVSLVISVLLGLVVFMLIVNDRTPVTSDAVPMLTSFFNSIGVSTILALIATAFILRLNHVSSGIPVPRYLARIRDCIAVALCMKKPTLAKRVELNFDQILLTETSTQYINTRDFAGQTPAARKSLNEQRILMELQKMSKHLEEENIANELKGDWHYTMDVFDRLFFLIFFVIFLFFASYVFSFF